MHLFFNINIYTFKLFPRIKKRGSNRREFCSSLTYRLFCLFQVYSQDSIPQKKENPTEASEIKGGNSRSST